MPERTWGIGLIRLALMAGFILAMGAAGSVRAAGVSYGEIEVLPDIEPRATNSMHGYTEYRFLVKNRSSDRTIKVTLQIPGDSEARHGPKGSLTSITRTVEVAPGGVTSISLLQPATPDVGGSGVAVFINGRKQEQLLRVNLVAGYTPPHMGMGYSRRRGRGGYRIMTSSTIPGTSEVLLLTSQRVPAEFFQVPGIFLPRGEKGWGGGVPIPPRQGGLIPPGVEPAPPKRKQVPPIKERPQDPEDIADVAPGGILPGLGTHSPFALQTSRSDIPISTWSSLWLAYSRYDGIAVTTEDLDELHHAGTESRATLQAIWQYVETGGVLLVLGSPGRKRPLLVPGGLKDNQGQAEGLLTYSVGFGQCIFAPDRDSQAWSQERWALISAAMRQTVPGWLRSRNIPELNASFPVVDNLGTPVKGLFALMVLFGITMGPVNLIMLSRYRRRIWLLWTVPAVALVFCLAVLGYMIIAEGWQGRARVAGLTILDETEKRATTIGQAGFYCPLTPGDGLRFSDSTEVQLLGDEHSAWSNSCSIDWTDEQHLSRGWISARVPAYFALRKSEPLRRERITLRKEGDGRLTAVNALGADITQLWLADAKGRLYRGDAIPAGGSALLERTDLEVIPGGNAKALRELLTTRDLIHSTSQMQRYPQRYLAPGTYLAVVESSPFLEQGLKNAQVRPSESYVFGIMADLAGKR